MASELMVVIRQGLMVHAKPEILIPKPTLNLGLQASKKIFRVRD